MAMDSPYADELVEAVREFLETKIAPDLSGFNAFQMRIAVNVLKIVERELQQYPDAEKVERAQLQVLLNSEEEDVPALSRALALAIREGRITQQTPGLMDHLWDTTMAKVAIDQPRYATFAKLAGEKDSA